MSKWLTPGVLKSLERIKNLKRGQELGLSLNELEDFRLATDILSLTNSGIVDWENTFVYSLKSKFIFGKFKDNELRHVWKVAPDYVEWCLINADGFIIDPNELEKILLEPVIDYDYLNTLLEEGNNRVTINLRNFPLNNNVFKVAPQEERYELSQSAVNANKKKLSKECHPFIIRKGSNWGDEKAVIRIPRRLSIVIYG